MAKLALCKSEIVNRLLEAKIELGEARRECELIVQHVTGLSAAEQILAADDEVSADHQSSVLAIVKRRLTREPLQYCLGSAWFMGMEFAVQKGVFIPRADTETLVEAALSLIDASSCQGSMHLAEIGIGSGAIAVSLLAKREKLSVTACDLLPDALNCARGNAEKHGVLSRIDLHLGDWRNVLPTGLDGIVSNPPYIPYSERDSLAPEISLFEPDCALFAGNDDGTAFYEDLAAEALNNLKAPDGFLAVEIGDGQAPAVERLLAAKGWREITVINDLNRLARVVTAKRPRLLQ